MITAAEAPYRRCGGKGNAAEDPKPLRGALLSEYMPNRFMLVIIVFMMECYLLDMQNADHTLITLYTMISRLSTDFFIFL